MAENSNIEWTDATWNPITGCSVVSPGCTNCYAMKLAGTRLQHHASRAGLTIDSKAGPVWNGEVRFNEDWILDPIKWRRPKLIFVCAHGDLFHESVPDAWIDRVFATMALAPQHTFQVLTKRSERMLAYLTAPGVKDRIYDLVIEVALKKSVNVNLIADGFQWDGRPKAWSVRLGEWPLQNVWLGASVEDQKRADERIPFLLTTPAKVRFLSCEPLLGPIDLREIRPDGIQFKLDALTGHGEHLLGAKGQTGKIDWVICGGESGKAARPMHPDWARSLREQCKAAGVAFHFKQWGEFAPEGPVGGAMALANDGALYAMPDLAYPDGRRRAEAIRANHDKANLTSVYRVGKKAAGRLLDGVTHDEFPEPRA